MTVTKKPTPEPRKRPSSQQFELLRLATEAGIYGFYRWQNVAINVWSGQPNMKAVQVLSELTERSLSECPEGIASIHWLDSGVGLPTAEARVGLGELARRYPKHVTCVGVLLQGSGFWASATRSALTGVMLLAPRTFALRFFADVGELSAYIVREQAQRGAPLDAGGLMAAIDDALTDSKHTRM